MLAWDLMTRGAADAACRAPDVVASVRLGRMAAEAEGDRLERERRLEVAVGEGRTMERIIPFGGLSAMALRAVTGELRAGARSRCGRR